MKAAIQISGQLSSNCTLLCAITSGRIYCTIEHSFQSPIMVFFYSKEDAKKALSNARKYLIGEGQSQATKKYAGDFRYNAGKSILYDASFAEII
jgi:uncharacterized protein (DUF1919 family)